MWRGLIHGTTGRGLFVKKDHVNLTDAHGAFLRVAVNVISVEFPLCQSTMCCCVNATCNNKLTHSKTESL